MNEKILKLMVEDFSEIYRVKEVELNPAHPMEMFDEYKTNSLDKFWGNKNCRYPYLSKDFNEEKEWFVNEKDFIRSISEEELIEELLLKKDFIIEKYYEIEEIYSDDLVNKVEIRTEILKMFLIEDEEIEEFEEVLYQDANIEAISELLQETTVQDIYINLSHYGSSMSIKIVDDFFILTQ